MERLIYISTARVSGLDDVRDILETAKRNNAAHGLTGMLWWQGQFFIQALEGETRSLDALLSKLKADPRHSELRVLGRKAIDSPIFGKWNMGLIASIENEEQFLTECLGHADLMADSLSADAMAEMLDRLVASFPPNMDRLLNR